MKALAVLFALCCTTTLFAQSRKSFSQHQLYVGNSVQSVTKTVSADDFSKPEHVQFKPEQARVKLDLTWQSELDYLSLLSGKEIKVGFTILFKGAGNDILKEVTDKELIATHVEPEQLYVYNFHKFFDDVVSIEVQAQLKPETISAGINTAVLQDLRLRIGYEINYEIDVRPADSQPALGITDDMAAEVTAGSRQVTFRWIPEFEAPYYEFQLLRLDEVEQLDATGQITGDISFYTDLNWDKALIVEMHNFGHKEANSDYHFLELTLAEQGYYTWRVRPVGNYYGKGGEYAFGDARNYGAWSQHLEAGKSMLINPSLGELPYLFYFEDPDKNLNYAYQRVLTEEGRLHESLSYADGLLRTRQNQRYLSSNEGDKKIIFTQSIYDYTGRPSLQLIPVPVAGDGRLNDYMKNQVLNADGSVYTADDFDVAEETEGGNYKSPGKITGSAYDYYNNPQAAERVASTGGYPYTRTILINDGTDRPLIQSGIGKEFVLGNEHKNEVTYFYSQPSDHELIMIFGEEALPKEAVLKVITKDPDGTTSVSYVTNEGTTIATALVFKNMDEYTSYQQVNKLTAADLPDTRFEETAAKNDLSRTGEKTRLSTSQSTEEDFVLVSTSSKEIAFTEGVNDLRISYRLDSKEEIVIGCDLFSYDNCLPTVRILVTDEEGNRIATITPNTPHTRIASGQLYTASIPASESDNMLITWETAQEGLTAGQTYYVIKELYVRDQQNLQGTVTERAEVLTAIADVIGSWLAEAATPSAMVGFYASTQNFSSLLGGAIEAACDREKGRPKPSGTPWPDFTIYGDERAYLNNTGSLQHYCSGFSGTGDYIELFPSFGLSYTIEDCNAQEYGPYLSLTADEYCILDDIGFFAAEGLSPITLQTTAGGFVSAEALRDEENTELIEAFKPDIFKLSTVCCGEIAVPVSGVPRPMCPDKFSEDDEERAEEMLDIAGKFVNYLQTSLIDDEELNADGITLKDLTPGYSALTLKSMLFHMLYDKYELAPGQESREQYTCPVLWAALKSTALTYEDIRRQYNDMNESGNDLRNPDGSDEETGNSKSEQDEAIDENFGKSVLAWFIKTFILKDKDMSEEVPSEMPLTLEYDFIDHFLTTVGYKYHRIVTSSETGQPGMLAVLEDNPPLETDRDTDEMPDFLKEWEEEGLLISNYYTSFDENGQPVSPDSDDNYGYANKHQSAAVFYSSSPVYRFKYAEYGPVNHPEYTSFITQESKAPRQLQLEMAYCFLNYRQILKDNTDSGAEFCMPLCEGKPNYQNWGAGQIKNFIKTLIASKDIQQPAPLSMDTDPVVGATDKQSLVDGALELMNSCSNRCESRREYIRLQVMREFDSNCYHIVNCADETAETEVTEIEIEEIVNAIIADCKEGCDGLVLQSNSHPVPGCATVFGDVPVSDLRINANGHYPCLQPMSICYIMDPVFANGKMTDIAFDSRTDAFRPHFLSAEQQRVYERLMGWEMEFLLDPSQRRCENAPVSELPCWLMVPPTCEGEHSAPVSVDMSQE